jgi:hypothetical protein
MNNDDKSERTEELIRAARYRVSAVDLRAMAVNGLDPAIKDALLQVANDYEAMAQTMESIHRTNTHIEADRKRPRRP